MPVVPINYLAVFVAAVASMVIGFLWYGPLFGKQWIALMGWSAQEMEVRKKKGGMGKTLVLAFIGSLVMAWVLAYALEFASVYMGVTGAKAGLMTGFWNWLGFITPVTLGTVLWEGKPWSLWFLNNAYWLVVLCLMGVIIALWPA